MVDPVDVHGLTLSARGPQPGSGNTGISRLSCHRLFLTLDSGRNAAAAGSGHALAVTMTWLAVAIAVAAVA
jgi:hypothetical protein